LKKIYYEYKNIINIIKKAGKIKKAYFTTFNFSFDFFETYILPPLLEVDIPTNEFEYENINEALENKKFEIKIFYDFSALNLQDKKRTIIEVTPVFIKDGFFHPKVIYIEGEKSYLIVGSNNLTLAGWGRNLESFFVLEVDEFLKKQVNCFFENINSLEKLKSYDNFDFEKKYNFLFGKKIKDLLKDQEVIVFSPYFSDIKSMIGKLQIKECYIVPDTVNNKIRLSNLPSDINFYFFKDFDSSRFNHSKVFVTKTHLIIGSYNFTHEAIDNNIESALAIKGDFFDEFKKRLELANVYPMDEDELTTEQEMFEKRFDIGVDLVFDYEKLEFDCKKLIEFDKKNIKIVLPPNIKKPLSCKIKLDNNEMALFLRNIIKNKTFTLEKDNKIIFEGIINEKNTKNTRSIYKVETLEDIFYSFLEDKPTKAKKTYEKYISKSLEEKNLKNSNDTLINYFSLFSGIEKLYETLSDLRTEQALTQFGYTDSNSLSNLKLVFEENKDKLSETMQYIFAYELNILIDKFNKKSKTKLNKIKYKKDKKIEKFFLETKNDPTPSTKSN